jgi:hypothetical protein
LKRFLRQKRNSFEFKEGEFSLFDCLTVYFHYGESNSQHKIHPTIFLRKTRRFAGTFFPNKLNMQ